MSFTRRFALASAAVLALAACGGSTETSGGGSGGGKVGAGGASASSSSSGSGGLGLGNGGSGGAAGTVGSSASATNGAGTGGSVSASGSSSVGATSTGSGGLDAGLPGLGDCQSDADCPGSHCVAVTPGGYRQCVTLPAAASTCSSEFDQCCDAMPCDGGSCLPGPLVPYCGGVAPMPHNQCGVDQCSQDGDCAAGSICGVAGTLGRLIRSCVPAGCKVDSDCTSLLGGHCEPVAEGCCGTTIGLYCVYPGTGCRSDADCGSGNHCEIKGSSAACVAGSKPCPP